jgi:hypothetical protein
MLKNRILYCIIYFVFILTTQLHAQNNWPSWPFVSKEDMYFAGSSMPHTAGVFPIKFQSSGKIDKLVFKYFGCKDLKYSLDKNYVHDCGFGTCFDYNDFITGDQEREVEPNCNTDVKKGCICIDSVLANYQNGNEYEGELFYNMDTKEGSLYLIKLFFHQEGRTDTLYLHIDALKHFLDYGEEWYKESKKKYKHRTNFHENFGSDKFNEAYKNIEVLLNDYKNAATQQLNTLSLTKLYLNNSGYDIISHHSIREAALNVKGQYPSYYTCIYSSDTVNYFDGRFQSKSDLPLEFIFLNQKVEFFESPEKSNEYSIDSENNPSRDIIYFQNHFRFRFVPASVGVAFKYTNTDTAICWLPYDKLYESKDSLNREKQYYENGCGRYGTLQMLKIYFEAQFIKNANMTPYRDSWH